MERHEAGTARVIPVILRPVDWHTAPFGKLQALPEGGKPVAERRNRDRAFVDVSRGIREVARSLLAKAPGSSASNRASTDSSPTANERPKSMDKTWLPLVVEPPDLILVELLEALPGRPISGERLVRPDGTISLGFYGDVHVAGLTLPEIKEKIVVRLLEYLSDETLGLVEHDPETFEPVVDPATGEPRLRDPKVSDRVFVDITAYKSQNYYVLGYVYRPGRLSYTGGDSVLDALQFAGGVLPSADRGNIRLIRSYPKGSPAQVLPVDYEELTMGTDLSTNYQIFPYDRLVVPSNPNYRREETGPTDRGETSRDCTIPITSPPLQPSHGSGSTATVPSGCLIAVPQRRAVWPDGSGSDLISSMWNVPGFSARTTPSIPSGEWTSTIGLWPGRLMR
jgi:polysaccharide export outer membrane protein